MRIVLTGGGTGGHIYPAISVGQALREAAPELELLFVGSSHGPEGALAAAAGISFRAVPSSPLTRSVSLSNVGSLARLAAGAPRARRILREFAPQVVLGTGGYTTAAVLAAARSLGCAIVIHEQNAVPGRTNRWLARIADRVCVSFESSARCFQARKVAVTGMPIRREFAALPARADARRALGLREDAFTILVVGGSQGARKLNDIALSAWPSIDDGATQALHQVGTRNLDDALAHPVLQAADAEEDRRYHVEGYVDMPTAMAAADLVISRAGASTIAEITAAGLPCVLFPYPYAYAMHQHHNARHLADHGAAVICDDNQTGPEALAELVNDLRASPGRLEAMASASRSLGRVDAADVVARVVISLAS